MKTKLILLAVILNSYFSSSFEESTNLASVHSKQDPPIETTSTACMQTLGLGAGHTLMIKTDGTLWAWGRNTNGELGDGTNIDKSSPVQIGTDTNWQTLSSKLSQTSHAIKTDGTLWGWGRNNSGQIGDGTTVDKNVPVQIGTDTDWLKISSGVLHTLAIKTDGTLWAWGLNSNGQIGDGTTVNKNIPVQISTATNWESCDASTDLFSAARTTQGLLYLWGSNFSGELGDGTTTDVLVPTLLNTSSYTTHYNLGFRYVVALRNVTGIIEGWGDNFFGQIGDGTNTNVLTPTPINTDNDWVFVDTGYYNTIAKKSDGTIWTWGYNTFGQLGNGNNTHTNTPAPINADTDWDQIFVGYHHTYATKTDGTLWVWGWNQHGAFGNGTTTSSNVPIQIDCSTLSTTNVGSNENFRIYPNPTQNFLTINANSPIIKTELIDFNGRTIQLKSQDKTEVILNIENLSKGIYFVKITSQNGSATKKIVKE